MDELQELFGEGTLSYADFSAKLNEHGIKLANIKAGGYVDKGKYDKLAGEFAKYKTENDVSKYADYDTIKTELEQLKAEKADAELAKEVEAAGIDSKFQKFVTAEVKALVTEKKDFKTCLGEYVKENPQFVVNPQRQNVFQKGSQANFESGEKSSASPTNKKMNEILRGVRKQ